MNIDIFEFLLWDSIIQLVGLIVAILILNKLMQIYRLLEKKNEK